MKKILASLFTVFFAASMFGQTSAYIHVNTIEDMVSYQILQPPLKRVFRVNDPVRGGDFDYQPIDVTDTNNFTVFGTSLGGTRRFIRQRLNYDIEVQWGAVTGADITWQTAQDALTLASTEAKGATVWLPSGVHTNLDFLIGLTIPSGVVFKAHAGGQFVQADGQANATAITAAGKSNFKIEDMTITLYPSNTNKVFSISLATNAVIAAIAGLEPGDFGDVDGSAGLQIFDIYYRENTPEAFGAVRDGVLDDTPALQTWVNWGALAAKRLNVPPGSALDYTALTNLSSALIFDESNPLFPKALSTAIRFGFATPTNIFSASGGRIIYKYPGSPGIRLMEDTGTAYAEYQKSGGAALISAYNGSSFSYIANVAGGLSYWQPGTTVGTSNPFLVSKGFGVLDIGQASTNLQYNSPALFMKGSGWDGLNGIPAQVYAGTMLRPIQVSASYPQSEILWFHYAFNGSGSTTNWMMSIRSDSGYTGAGTLFLSDDGTFKSSSSGSGGTIGTVTHNIVTNNVAEGFVSLEIPDNETGGAHITYLVEALDGTEAQSDFGSIDVSLAFNSADTDAKQNSQSYQSGPVKTGATTFTVTFSSASILGVTYVRVTANSSLTTTTYRIKYKVETIGNVTIVNL